MSNEGPTTHRPDMKQVPVSVRVIATSGGPARVHMFPAAGPQPARGTLLLGHGAGAGVESQDLQALTALSERGWCVALLEQPWRVAGRRVAVAPAKLDQAAIDALDAMSADPDPLPRPWVLGGRSAGARVACRLFDRAQALLLIAFPLQPPRARTRLAPSRIGELLLPVRNGIPVLVMQGARDRFGGPDDIVGALAHADEAPGVPGADGAAPLTIVRPYPGDHGPSRDPAALVDDALVFLNALP